MIHELTCVLGEHVEKSRQAVELIDVGDLAHIAIEDQADIVLLPRASPARRCPPHRLGIAAPEHGIDEIVSYDSLGLRWDAIIGEEEVYESAWRAS